MSVTRDQVRRSRYMAGRVKRYHTWPVHHQETVAEHTFGVLSIYREMFGLEGAPVEYIMDHDRAEIVTGDLPFPVKARNPALANALADVEAGVCIDLGLPGVYQNLTPRTKARVKICDLLQMWEFGVAELQMGNTYAKPIVEDTATVAIDLAVEAECSGAVIDWMMKRENV